MPALSGQKMIAVPGTAEALGNQPMAGGILVKALTSNSGLVYLGNDGAGDVDSSNGYPLAAGDAVIFELIGDLRNLMIDAAVADEGVAWLALNC